jgi:50S ribosomal subunit-associated GTPase HflX
MFRKLTAGEREVTFLLPYARGSELEVLHESCRVRSLDYTDSGIRVTAVCPPEVYGRLREFVVNDE